MASRRKLSNLLDKFDQTDGGTSVTVARKGYEGVRISVSSKGQEVMENWWPTYLRDMAHKISKDGCWGQTTKGLVSLTTFIDS